LTYDVNYTWTNIDALTSNVKTLDQTVRLRCRFHAWSYEAYVYGGASYQRVKATQWGSMDLNGVPVDFSLRAREAYPWNGIAGAQLDVTPHWGMTLEGGFSGRRQFLASLDYRF
jgi:hypothetical protein